MLDSSALVSSSSTSISTSSSVGAFAGSKSRPDTLGGFGGSIERLRGGGFGWVIVLSQDMGLRSYLGDKNAVDLSCLRRMGLSFRLADFAALL